MLKLARDFPSQYLRLEFQQGEGDQSSQHNHEPSIFERLILLAGSHTIWKNPKMAFAYKLMFRPWYWAAATWLGDRGSWEIEAEWHHQNTGERRKDREIDADINKLELLYITLE